MNRRLLREDTGRWGVPAAAGEWLFLAPFVGGLLVALLSFWSRGYFALLRENSVVEYLQAAGFALAGLCALLAARGFWLRTRKAPAAAFLVLAAGFVFLAGEEISWGQYLLGFDTPEPLLEVNQQGEVSVHNIGAVRVALKLVAIAVGLAGFALPWIARARGWGSSFVPPLFLTSAFLALAAYNIVRLVLYPGNFFRGGDEVAYGFARYSEWPELCLAYVALAYAYLSWRRTSVAGPASR